MTRLCGLPSDEPFAIPATRTVPVFAVRARRLPVCEVFAVRVGYNHDQHLAKGMRWSGTAETAGLARDLTRSRGVQACPRRAGPPHERLAEPTLPIFLETFRGQVTGRHPVVPGEPFGIH